MGKRAQAGVAQPAGKVGKTQRGADFPEAAAHLAEIHQAVQQIAKHPVLQDILTAEPVEFGARDKWGNVGYKHPFNVQQYRNAMMSQGAAEFAGNFFWCNPCWLALHGVPPNKRQLLEISDRDFAEPVEFPDCITLAAPDKHFPDGQKHVDWFKRVTPEEVVHAYLLAVARDAQDVETPPETMTLWRKYLLSTTFRVVLASGEAVHWLTVKHREEMTRRRGLPFPSATLNSLVCIYVWGAVAESACAALPVGRAFGAVLCALPLCSGSRRCSGRPSSGSSRWLPTCSNRTRCLPQVLAKLARSLPWLTLTQTTAAPLVESASRRTSSWRLCACGAHCCRTRKAGPFCWSSKRNSATAVR